VINLEYLWLVLLILPFLVFLTIKQEERKIKSPQKPVITQSRMVVLMNDIEILRNQLYSKEFSSQATEYYDKKNVRVIVIDETAYWISDNRLYSADFVDGEIDLETKKVVDTFALDEIQLKKMSSIVDTLTAERFGNEGWDTGH
jgi:hypothetical protein